MDSDDMLACYEALARLAVDALTAAETRDWEAFSRQQEREAATLAMLKRQKTLMHLPAEVLNRQEAMIRLILEQQRKIEALVLPWRDEVGAQLQSASSSRMLARAYGAQDGG